MMRLISRLICQRNIYRLRVSLHVHCVRHTQQPGVAARRSRSRSSLSATCEAESHLAAQPRSPEPLEAHRRPPARPRLALHPPLGFALTLRPSLGLALASGGGGQGQRRGAVQPGRDAHRRAGRAQAVRQGAPLLHALRAPGARDHMTPLASGSLALALALAVNPNPNP